MKNSSITNAERFSFSANLGFLWKELPFLDRILQAKEHEFSAIEFHDEAQSCNLQDLQIVLNQTKLPVCSLNTRMGTTSGCAAIPEFATQAKEDVDHAIQTAKAIGAQAIHVVAGGASGADAHRTYLNTLRYALAQTDKTILIEPISHTQNPGYFLRTMGQAAVILDEIDHSRLKIMFDCYHVHSEGGNVLSEYQSHAHQIGHIQIAAAEGRAEPSHGTLNYEVLLPGFQAAGYNGCFGCEYRPATTTQAGLGWREKFQ